jgi:hypothetical protein
MLITEALDRTNSSSILNGTAIFLSDRFHLLNRNNLSPSRSDLKQDFC